MRVSQILLCHCCIPGDPVVVVIYWVYACSGTDGAGLSGVPLLLSWSILLVPK